MEAPRVEGFKIRSLMGSGGCGHVYLAADEAGALFAVKVFDGMSIQRGLLARMTSRLEADGWPEGVVPVVFSNFDSRPALCVTPWLADGDAEGDSGVTPRTLQEKLVDHPGDNTWPLVRELARALAAMHERRVAHGNLKPGNVFFNESGGLLLADWTLGNMPGVGRFDFTDAVLYQAPEQLLDPVGYGEEAGYRWDVFAFGTLAFRLLTGRFPRCHEIFSLVAPGPGEVRREGIHADLPKIARNLKSHPEVTWPDGPENALEAGFREWLGRCLDLDPMGRPATMLEVVAGFETVEKQVAAEAERENLLDQRRRSDRRAWRSMFMAGVATTAAVLLGGLWQLTATRLRQEKQDRQVEKSTLKERADTAIAAREIAEKTATEAVSTMEYEHRVSLDRLMASREQGDRLFSWAMEKGNRQLPPLDGREQRLKRLERYYEDFLVKTAEIKTLDEERARARLQLAEISLSSGNTQLATTRLTEALTAWDNQPMDPELSFRVATNRLLLALLRQSGGDPAAETAFVEARKALTAVPEKKVDADRLRQLIAVLDFHEAKLIAARGDDGKALNQLLQATQALNDLAKLRPDTSVLRSELAACYLSSATILEGMGTLGDAREVRTQALKELTELLKKDPESFPLRLEMAGCFGAMAESAVLAGDITAAESLSKKAMDLLDKLAREQPDNAEVVTWRAAQLGLNAGLLRDRGQAKESIKAFDEGISMLESVRASAPDDAGVTYRLALLGWQKARMPGTDNQHDEQIRLLTNSRKLLAELEGKHQAKAPPQEQIERTTAYVLGDLGHALQLDEKPVDAKAAFSESVTYWDRLLRARSKSEEYLEGSSWCKQRLKELDRH